MKEHPDIQNEFLEDFKEWFDSKDGTQSMEALEYVSEMLEEAEVDVKEQKIIWTDGQRLTIEESVRRIQKACNLKRAYILSHLIGWLQMSYEPQGLDEIQMELFEEEMDEWLHDYEEEVTRLRRFGSA